MVCLELLDPCSRISGDILGKAISKQHRRGSSRIFCNPNALVSPLWVEGRGQAHNAEVVIGDLFATRNPLKLHAARKILYLYSATFVPSRPSCARIQGRRSSNITGLKFFPLHRSGSGFVQSGFYEVALTPALRATLCHATSQNPPDSRVARYQS